MAKMIAELLTRWRCMDCGYITFKTPNKGTCPNCSYGVDYAYMIGEQYEKRSNNTDES